MATIELIQAVAVTAELCGRTFTPEAARVFVEDLDGFPERAVLTALRRCRREVRGALTVQDVVSRVDDGRPGPEEAWAMLPKSEAQSVVWTDEMAAAFNVALPLIEEGQQVSARMAFKEAYIADVAKARDQRKAPNWQVSLGHDIHGREPVLRQAVELNRIASEYAAELIPQLPMRAPAAVLELANGMVVS